MPMSSMPNSVTVDLNVRSVPHVYFFAGFMSRLEFKKKNENMNSLS